MESSATSVRSGAFWLAGLVAALAFAQCLTHVRRFFEPGGSAWTIGFTIDSDTAATAQLFYDRGEGYNQRDSSTASVRAESANELTFAVRGASLSRLRFDPLDTAGVVRIRAMWRGDAHGQHRTPLDPRGFAAENQIADLRVRDDALEVRTVSPANDPMLSFAPATPLQAPARFSTGLRWIAVLLLAGAAAFHLRAAARAYPFPGWLALLGVATAALTMLWGLHLSLDVPLWDEANYLAAGRRAQSGDFGPLDGAATYHVWYALLLRLWPDEHAVFANHYLLKLALPLLATLVARRWFDSWLSGALLGIATALSSWSLGFPLLVYQAAFAWWLAALATIDRQRALGIAFAVLAALTRLEFIFPLLAWLGIWLIGTITRRRTASPPPAAATATPPRSRGPRFAAIAAWTFVAILLFGLSDWNPGVSRSWFAFRQHYAVAASERGEFPGENPWLAYPKFIQRDMPEADSLRSALAKYPDRVLGHIGHNLSRAPTEIGTFFAISSPLPAGIALLLLGSCAIIAGHPRRTTGYRAWWTEHGTSASFAICGLVATVPGLIIYAKTAYLLPAVPVIWLLVAGLAVGLTRFSGTPISRFGTAVGIVAMLATTWLVTASTSPFPPFREPRPVVGTLAALRRECPVPCRILGVSSSSYAHYLGAATVGVEPLASTSGSNAPEARPPLPELVRNERIDVVLVTADWRRSGVFDDAGLALLEAGGWRPVAVPVGDLWIRPARLP